MNFFLAVTRGRTYTLFLVRADCDCSDHRAQTYTIGTQGGPLGTLVWVQSLRFDGSSGLAMRNCSDDFDCPVAFMCDVNKQCSCNIWFDWQGKDCTEPGEATWFIYVFSTLYAVAGLVGFLWIFKQIVSVARKDTSILTRRNTVVLAHGLNGLAFAAFGAWHVFYFLEAYTPESTTLSIRLAGPEFNRTSTWAVVTRTFIVSTQIIATLATLHLSMAWVDVGYKADTLSKEKRKSMKIILTCLEVLFIMTMVGISFTGQLELAAIVISPFVAILVILILVGRSKLVHQLSKAVALVDPSDMESSSDFNDAASTKPVPDANKFADDPFSRRRQLQGSKARHEMQRIRTSSFHIALSLIIIIGSGIAFFMMTWLPKDSWKGLRTPNGASLVTYTVNSIPLGLLYLLCAIHWYTRVSVTKIIGSTNVNKRNTGRLSSSAMTGFPTQEYFGYDSSVGHETHNFQSHLGE